MCVQTQPKDKIINTVLHWSDLRLESKYELIGVTIDSMCHYNHLKALGAARSSKEESAGNIHTVVL